MLFYCDIIEVESLLGNPYQFYNSLDTVRSSQTDSDVVFRAPFAKSLTIHKENAMEIAV